MHLFVSMFFAMVTLLVCVHGQIKVAILMQGSDFINVTVVPLFDVNQFDLGDVFISPCRAGTYNEARDSYCKDCSVCTAYQYERETCISVRNRVCQNCTECTAREQQICECNQRSQDCPIGDRICLPLPPTSANISFDLSVSVSLSPLKERFLQEGLRTGFILFLGDYLQHSPDFIVFMYLLKLGPRQYYTSFIVSDVYSMYTKGRVAQISQAIVQEGLTSTFGIQSNTFSTVSRQRRRRLLQQQPAASPIELTADGITSTCKLDGVCPRFFAMSYDISVCNRTCQSLPCPPGYTGFYGMCEICPNATFKPTNGSDSCTPCPIGWGSEQGASDLTQCWPPSTTSVSPTVPLVTTSSPVTWSTHENTTQPLVVGSSPVTVSGGTGTTTVQTPRSSAMTSTIKLYFQTTTPALPIGIPSSSTGPSTTPPPVDGGWPPWWPWGGGVPGSTMPPSVVNNINTNNNYQIFNVTLVQKFFMTDWNTGHAGTTQYIMVNEKRDEWALTMVVALMLTGFLSIAAIGARLFWLRARPDSRAAGSKTIVYEKDDGKKVIPIPINKPDPQPPKNPPVPATPPKRSPSTPRSRPFIPLGLYGHAYQRIPTEYDLPL